MQEKITLLLNDLSNFLQKEQIILDKSLLHPFLIEKRGNFISECAFAVTPNNTNEVSKIMNLCSKYNISVVPESGNTSLVSGTVSNKDQIILSLKNLNKIREIDTKNQTLVVESGVTLEDTIEYCKSYNLFFPLNLPSRKNCMIGGNLSSNAGGLNTLKYGTIKNFTLGLEVVLSDGKIISDLNKLTKRNIGPDSKSLFIGSEGILGIITAGSFKLFPIPSKQIHILFSSVSVDYIIEVYKYLKSIFNMDISAFEIMNNNAVNISLKEYPSFFPLARDHNWYSLISIDSYNDNNKYYNIRDMIYNSLKEMYNKGFIIQFFTSSNLKIWDFRDLLSEAQKKHGKSLKHDIGIPLSQIEQFIIKTIKSVHNITDIAVPIVFGHIGDQSLHFNFTTTNPSKQNEQLLYLKQQIKETVINLAIQHNGSFSSEHGIGLIYKDELEKYYSNNQLYMIKLFKKLLDPNNILNPNKVINSY